MYIYSLCIQYLFKIPDFGIKVKQYMQWVKIISMDKLLSQIVSILRPELYDHNLLLEKKVLITFTWDNNLILF